MSDNKTSVIARARAIIDNYHGQPIRIMEVCGTHTHEIFRLGIRQILPDKVRLISGPGCPVCVTPVNFIDEAVYLAMERDVTICTFGDLVRVPGSLGTPAPAQNTAVNDKTAKAGTDVEIGDKIHIEFGNSSLTVRVVKVAESGRKDDAADMYEVIE